MESLINGALIKLMMFFAVSEVYGVSRYLISNRLLNLILIVSPLYCGSKDCQMSHLLCSRRAGRGCASNSSIVLYGKSFSQGFSTFAVH